MTGTLRYHVYKLRVTNTLTPFLANGGNQGNCLKGLDVINELLMNWKHSLPIVSGIRRATVLSVQPRNTSVGHFPSFERCARSHTPLFSTMQTLPFKQLTGGSIKKKYVKIIL